MKVPDISLRPTASPSLYGQRFGKALQGKVDAGEIIDYVGDIKPVKDDDIRQWNAHK